jgi:hypothetical protein
VRAEDALGKLRIASVMTLLPKLQVGSVIEGASCLYWDFSPRARPYPLSLHIVSSAIGSEFTTKVVAPCAAGALWETIYGAHDGGRLFRGLDGGHDTLATAKVWMILSSSLQ